MRKKMQKKYKLLLLLSARSLGHLFFSKSDIEDETDIRNLGASQILENGNQVQQFVVMSVREPAADRNGVLRVEYVRGRRVVDDDGIFQITSDLGQILDVIALVVVAAFAEQSMVDDIVNIKLV